MDELTSSNNPTGMATRSAHENPLVESAHHLEICQKTLHDRELGQHFSGIPKFSLIMALMIQTLGFAGETNRGCSGAFGSDGGPRQTTSCTNSNKHKTCCLPTAALFRPREHGTYHWAYQRWSMQCCPKSMTAVSVPAVSRC